MSNVTVCRSAAEVLEWKEKIRQKLGKQYFDQTFEESERGNHIGDLPTYVKSIWLEENMPSSYPILMIPYYGWNNGYLGHAFFIYVTRDQVKDLLAPEASVILACNDIEDREI